MAVEPCGHGQAVNNGRCWDCWLAHLREVGQGARADRLVERKRQLEEGRFDLERAVKAMVDAWGEQMSQGGDADGGAVVRERLDGLLGKGFGRG